MDAHLTGKQTLNAGDEVARLRDAAGSAWRSLHDVESIYKEWGPSARMDLANTVQAALARLRLITGRKTPPEDAADILPPQTAIRDTGEWS